MRINRGAFGCGCAEALTPPQASARPGLVLVVDDSSPARTCIRAILSPFGWEIDEADDGASAFTRLLARPFDLLVTDLRMSPVGGADLVMAVQLLPADRKPCTIICSADHDSDDPNTVRATGYADSVIAKPISATLLATAALKLMAQGRRS